MSAKRHCLRPVPLLLWHWRPGSPADETLPGSSLPRGSVGTAGSQSRCAPPSGGPSRARAGEHPQPPCTDPSARLVARERDKATSSGAACLGPVGLCTALTAFVVLFGAGRPVRRR